MGNVLIHFQDKVSQDSRLCLCKCVKTEYCTRFVTQNCIALNVHFVFQLKKPHKVTYLFSEFLYIITFLQKKNNIHVFRKCYSKTSVNGHVSINEIKHREWAHFKYALVDGKSVIKLNWNLTKLNLRLSFHYYKLIFRNLLISAVSTIDQ